MPVGIASTYISGISTSVSTSDAAFKQYVDNQNTAPLPDTNLKYPFLVNTGSRTAWLGITSFTEYTAGGTYTFDVPSQAKELTIIITGGGGGGAGGISGPANNYGNDVGGGGGGGGASLMFSIPTSSIVGTAVTVTVGLAGTGGNGSPGSSTSATAGANGGRTTVIWNSLSGSQSVFANGGSGGSIGVHASTGGAGGPGGSPSALSNYIYSVSGTAGGRGGYAIGLLAGLPGTTSSSGYQCTGGGGGGANSGSNITHGSGGAIYLYSNTYQITTQGSSSVVINGLSYGAGAAGGQGSQSTGSPGGSGSRGGGGGGGGGGQGQNVGFPVSFYASGNGGPGGSGYALILWRG